MARFTALYDACVLYPAPLRDLLVQLAKYDIEPQHPDDFISCQFDLNPPTVCSAIKKLRQRLQNPPRTLPEYIETIERQELPRTAGRMRQFDNLLSF
jgi:hypothetical protein